MLTLLLPRDSYSLITGDEARTIHREFGLTIGADEWQALQRAVARGPVYAVTCDESVAASLLDWFERTFEASRTAPEGTFGEPSFVLHSCRRASATIRAALAAPRPPGPVVR